MIAWALFIPACFALNCAPGPNNMLAFSNAARLGFGRAYLGGMGRMPAFALMISITVVGLGAALAASASLFVAIKLVGAAYLVYVGIRILIGARRLAEAQSAENSVKALMRRDFTIAITNPKAIAIFTAFFPQFIVASAGPAWEQLAAMGCAFLVMETVAVAIYACVGALIGGLIASRRVFVGLNRFVGIAMIIAGAGMAVSRG